MNYPTLDEVIGKTPLVRLQRLGSGDCSARGNVILGKLEGNNPAGSVKDRPALSMIARAQERGDIQPGDTLIEATSGNTGIALAMAAAIKGYRMVLIMPEDLSIERAQTMKAFGAELILTPKSGGESFLVLKSEESPVITIANDGADYGNDFAAFKAAVKAQPVAWAGGVLRFATIEFHGPARPGLIAGQPVNLAASRGYDSPFIRSDWGSGLIHLRKGNETAILDFRDPANPDRTVGAPVTAAFPPGVGTTRPIVFGKN
jgi:hypothetical protein